MKSRAAFLLMALIMVASGARADSISGGNATLTKGDRVQLEYVSSGEAFKAFKPYIRQLSSPGGVNLLRDNVADHIHHHALMFAVAVDGVDFWSEQKNCGKQLQKSLSFRGTGGKPGNWARRLLQGELEWVSSDGKPIAKESRTIELYGGTPDCTMLTWRTRLSPPADKQSIQVTGSHYFGLGIRFVESMDKADSFMFAEIDAKSTVVRGSEKVTPSKWVAFSGPVDGKVVTVAMFDYPNNQRKAYWFTMYDAFAYLSATINLFREPLTVKADQPLDLRYGLAVWDGKVDRQQVEKACQHWLQLVDAAK